MRKLLAQHDCRALEGALQNRPAPALVRLIAGLPEAQLLVLFRLLPLARVSLAGTVLQAS